MKYLGIDYGTKKIGIAISDERGQIAFPREIIVSNEKSIEKIKYIIDQEKIKKIIIGHSVNMDGSENTLQTKIKKFIEQLQAEINIPINSEKEWLSSIAARSHLYGKGNIANEKWTGKQNQKRRDDVDAGAAAIILQRYLDKQNK